MKRKLFVLSDHESDLLSTLGNEFVRSSGPLPVPASRPSRLERGHVLFIDATVLDESTIPGDASVRAAMSSGIPVVILRPTSGLLKALTGCGIDDVAAALLVRGRGRTTYCKIYTDARAARSFYGEAWSKGADAGSEDEPAAAGAPPSTGTIGDFGTVEELDLRKIVEDLAQADQIEEILAGLDDSPGRSNQVPQNRDWSTYIAVSPKGGWLGDPSEETSNRQNIRIEFGVQLRLLAMDSPTKNKVLGVRIDGWGFEPRATNEGLIRDDHKHRGWAQSVTKVTVDPSHEAFGSVKEYVPSNAANVTSVSAGFDWSVGFSGGNQGGSVSASFSKSQSHTVSSVDFKTLTDRYLTRGIRFFQNAYIVGGDTQVDPKYFGFNNLANQSGWTGEMSKMFYQYALTRRVRSWPDLSKQLVRPYSEALYITGADERRSGRMTVTAGQGMNYFYTKGGSERCVSYWHEKSVTIDVDFSQVNYNDPA